MNNVIKKIDNLQDIDINTVLYSIQEKTPLSHFPSFSSLRRALLHYNGTVV